MVSPPASATTVRPRRVVGPVTAIGDSVLVDAASALRAALPGVTIDAAVDRSALPAPDILQSYAARGQLGRSIVFALGLNGGVTTRLVDRVLAIAGGRRVVMVTNHCPHCTYTAAENETVRRTCRPRDNCAVAEWDHVASAHPEWFAPDGVHFAPGSAAARAFASLVRDKLLQ